MARNTLENLNEQPSLYQRLRMSQRGEMPTKEEIAEQVNKVTKELGLVGSMELDVEKFVREFTTDQLTLLGFMTRSMSAAAILHLAIQQELHTYRMADEPEVGYEIMRSCSNKYFEPKTEKG
jgi:hypothetical protein